MDPFESPLDRLQRQYGDVDADSARQGLAKFATSPAGAWVTAGFVLVTLYRLVLPSGGGLAPKLPEEDAEAMTEEEKRRLLIDYDTDE